MKIIEYGLTESTVACSVNPKDGERKIGSIGLRLPYMEIKIVVFDENGNFVKDAEDGEIGIVCIKGPCIFTGYVEDVHNKGIWHDGDWFVTGDLGRKDNDEFLFLTGRERSLSYAAGTTLIRLPSRNSFTNFQVLQWQQPLGVRMRTQGKFQWHMLRSKMVVM